MSTNGQQPKLKLSGVKKHFGKKVVLDGIDLEIEQGKSLVVIGASGTGKSVMLKCVLGLLKPDEGSIMVDGEETTHLRGSERDAVMEKFGMLFQGGALFDSMKVWENVAFGLIHGGGMDRKKAWETAIEKIVECPACGNLDTVSPCTICQDPRRDQTLVVVVEEVGDLWALERASTMKANYHVLGGTLSPLDGVGPDDLNIRGLVARVAEGCVREIVLAVNATVEGQTTAHYLTDQLASFGVKVTRLAHGVPVGGELDYLDEGTLAAALKSRTAF